jgi:CHAT domain-containing protein
LEVYPLELDQNFGQNIQDIHQILTNPPTSQNFPTQLQQFSLLSQNLYQQLVPFSIDPSIQQLLIIPDDILHYLPFEILCTNSIENPISFAASNFGYLLKDYAIHYAYSLTLWQQALQKKSNKAPKKWIGFAPSFKTGNTYAQRACEMNELYDLSCSKEEVNQIQTFFGGDIFLGQEANKENFQQLAADYQIIHLATHACVDNQDGDLNRIFLVDDFLNNNDLSNYNLNADLAVLSACNTGSGEIIKGEGIYSISRGFIMAGVPSTLTTLWSVDDCTTSNLMQSFYQKLDEGLSKAAALRNAKLEHLENAEVITTHPYFWAAFIQSGNPNAIKRSSFRYWWVALAIIAALGVLFIFNRKRS